MPYVSSAMVVDVEAADWVWHGLNALFGPLVEPVLQGPVISSMSIVPLGSQESTGAARAAGQCACGRVAGPAAIGGDQHDGPLGRGLL